MDHSYYNLLYPEDNWNGTGNGVTEPELIPDVCRHDKPILLGFGLNFINLNFFSKKNFFFT